MSTKKNTNIKAETKLYPDEIKYYLEKTSNFYDMLLLISQSEIVFVEAISDASYLEVAELLDGLNTISRLLKKCDELKNFKHSSYHALEMKYKQ